MREYSNKIALIKNDRGIYGLDTSIGCSSGMANEPGGCYNDCYAAKSAKQYGYDFSKTVLRYFTSLQYEREIIIEISKIKLDFVRIGCSGDPSENWDHCLSILKVISKANKEIVIITKHWNNFTDDHLEAISKLNVCINTSVSALDKPELLQNSLTQYHRIKKYCKSVLRIVSCDFNLDNKLGKELSIIQDSLFQNEDTLDTVLRPRKGNGLVTKGIINAHYGLFLGKKCFISKYNRKTYTGKCSNCHEMCGVKMKNENYTYVPSTAIVKQMRLFKL